MAQYIYSMHRVSKVVPPKKTVLKDISLSFFPGAKIGVLGLNGAGKSTLLRIMAGVDKEYEGEAQALKGTKIGYLPQEPELDPAKTVRETVEEAVEDVKSALSELDELYAAYADPDADFVMTPGLVNGEFTMTPRPVEFPVAHVGVGIDASQVRC